jgi:single-stranded-DNA-specific exonuclease
MEIRERAADPIVERDALQRGFTPLQARIIAGRIREPAGLNCISRPLRELTPPDRLPDIAAAADAIATAITSGRPIGVCTDADCDGSSSHFVLRTALLDHFRVPETQVISTIAHRLKDGYGINDAFADRLIELSPSGALCITADQGSTDETRIARMLAEKGIETVVTDHHGIPDSGIPRSALACVNPVRKDSMFGDPYIAGCHVAWLVMCAVRQRLIASGWLPPDAPSLATLLDVVAVGTCADAVSLGASRNNRIILAYGVKLMNKAAPRECWNAIRKVAGIEGAFVTRDISHGIAPRLNAKWRMGEAMASVDFLCSKDPVRALEYAELLDRENKARRKVQDGMTEPGLAVGAEQVKAGRAALCVFFPEGHSGVHGIVASRLVETYGRPVCCLSPKNGDPDVVVGSLRSVPGVNIREALAHVAAHHPGCLAHWGGHPGAAGLSTTRANIDLFHDAFCAAVEAQADPATFGAAVLTDGAIPCPLSLDVLDEIAALEPYGREFEPPVFCDAFTVADARPVGDGSHLKLTLVDAGGEQQSAIWFRAMEPGAFPPIGAGEQAKFAYSLAGNTFRGETRLDLHILAIREAA